MYIKTLFLLFIIFAYSRVVMRFTRRDCSAREFAGWSFFWGAAAVLIVWPEILSRIAVLLQVGRGVDLAIYIALLLIFYLLFRLFVRSDRLERDLTELVRRDALERTEHSSSVILRPDAEESQSSQRIRRDPSLRSG